MESVPHAMEEKFFFNFIYGLFLQLVVFLYGFFESKNMSRLNVGKVCEQKQDNKERRQPWLLFSNRSKKNMR
jgi:hypothetical protein